MEIANQPHQPIVDIPQLITAKLRVGIWERETTIDVHESSFQEPKKIIRKSTARIKHAHGKYVVFHAYDEEGNKVHTEVHSYSSKAKKLLSVGISNNGTVSRMVGIPNLKKRTIDWEMEFSQSNKTAQMSITCDKDGMSIQIKGREKLEEKVKASWTAIAKWTDDLTAEALADNKTPEISIWEAAFKGNIEAVKKNLAMGIDIGSKDQVFDGTPLHHAAYGGKNEVALFLINKGADINAIGGPKGFPAMETPLDVATRQSQNQ
ncbi:MAG: ankyrin repeat domain-containing protein, partial [Verrucomicrobiales bacterium]